jgi:hypothetical protein
MLCRASEDELSEAAPSEGAFQHKVGADIACLVEDDLAGGTLIGLQNSAGCRNTMPGEVGGNLAAAGAGNGVSLHSEDLDTFRGNQERHAECDRTR